jgi:hypothetical protein
MSNKLVRAETSNAPPRTLLSKSKNLAAGAPGHRAGWALINHLRSVPYIGLSENAAITYSPKKIFRMPK